MNDESDVLCKRFQAVDGMKYTPNHMIDANKALRTTKTRTRKKPKQRQQMKTKLHYQRYQLRRRIWFTLRRVTIMVDDMHHKISSWLANNYRDVILSAFRTSEMVRKYTRDVVADVAPDISAAKVDLIQLRPTSQRRIRSSTARAMQALAHYKFKMLLKCKMAQVGGRVIDCNEKYTSKTCSLAAARSSKSLVGTTLARAQPVTSSSIKM